MEARIAAIDNSGEKGGCVQIRVEMEPQVICHILNSWGYRACYGGEGGWVSIVSPSNKTLYDAINASIEAEE